MEIKLKSSRAVQSASDEWMFIWGVADVSCYTADVTNLNSWEYNTWNCTNDLSTLNYSTVQSWKWGKNCWSAADNSDQVQCRHFYQAVGIGFLSEGLFRVLSCVPPPSVKIKNRTRIRLQKQLRLKKQPATAIRINEWTRSRIKNLEHEITSGWELRCASDQATGLVDIEPSHRESSSQWTLLVKDIEIYEARFYNI